MKYIQRAIESDILQSKKTYKAILVTGARQVGKSTTLKHLLKSKCHCVSLDDPFLEEQVRAAGIQVVQHETELNMLELNPMRLTALRAELLGDVTPVSAPHCDQGLPTRPPVLCPGCSHRSVFYILHKLGSVTVKGPHNYCGGKVSANLLSMGRT